MKKIKMIKMLAFILAVAMTTVQSGPVFAAEGTVSEEAAPVTAEEGTVSEEEAPAFAEEDAAGEEEETDFSPEEEAAASEESVLAESTDTILQGMPAGFVLSQTEILGKKEITEHGVIAKLEALEPGRDYVEDEVIFPCDDPEYAKTVAEAYNGTLESCYLGVAVIKLDTARVTVIDAVKAGADISNSLPPVDPNTKNYLTDPVVSSVADTEESSSIKGGILAKKKDALDSGNWTFWTKDKGFNDPALDPGWKYEGNERDGKIRVNGYQWMHDAVGSYKAWGVTRGEGVTVAVIDTGVLASHEDLGTDRVDMSAYSVEPFNTKVDNSGHGTHVAGIIAAKAGNGKGGTGIAPDAKLLAVPVFENDGSYTPESLARAIDYVANEGGDIRAQVINMSLGGPIYTNTEQVAITKAYKKKITICVAMGNDTASCVKYPAGYDNVVAVTAMNASWSKSDFSTFGSWADVAAPGTAIFSTWNGHTEKDTYTDFKDYYGSWDGTSMACPVVAGVCALYISAVKSAGRPAPTPDQVEEALKMYATKVSSPYKIGAGMVNVAAMLESLEETYEPDISVPDTLSENSTITFGENHAAGGTLGYIVTVNGKKPSAANGEIKEGFFIEAENGNAAVKVSDLLDKGLKVKEPVKLMAARITALGTMTETASEVIRYEGSISTGVSINGSGVLAKGKSLTYTLNRKTPKNSLKWELASGPQGVNINPNTGKVTASKTASGSFKVAALVNGERVAEKEVWLVDAASSLTLKPAKTASMNADVNTPVYYSNGNLKTVRLFNADVPDNSDLPERMGLSENMLQLEGKTDNDLIPVEYTSSKPSVATVDSTGVVTAKKAGTVKITCKAADGSNKKASVTLKVIVPVSRLDIFRDRAEQCVCYGKTLKLNPVLGSAYGTPSVKKLKWEITAVIGCKDLNEYKVVTEDARNYVKVTNGKLTVNKKLGSVGDYPFYRIYVKISTTDGSGLAFEKEVVALAPATVVEPCKVEFDDRGDIIKVGDIPKGEIQVIPVGYDSEEDIRLAFFRSDLGFDFTKAVSTPGNVYGLEPEVISSDPAVASVYVGDRLLIDDRDPGKVYYVCIITAKKPGTATVTMKATDSSGKKGTLKLKVVPKEEYDGSATEVSLKTSKHKSMRRRRR